MKRLPGHGLGCPAIRDPRTLLALLGAAMLALTLLALAAHGRWDADYGFVAVVLAQGAVYLLAARLIARAPRDAATLAIIIAIAAALRFVLLFASPIHSTDIYRYVWDGRVQAAGINPYRYVPADKALANLRDEKIYPNINRANYAVTIYPPAAQGAFWLFTRITERVWAVKLGWLALEAAAMVVLVWLRRRAGKSAAGLLLYAWHPLPLWAIACDGHVDAGMAAFLVFAIGTSIAGRRMLTGALLAISALFKPLTLAALPAFWKPRDWRLPAAFVTVVALAYLPYAGIGTRALGFLPTYVGEEGIASGQGFLALRLLTLAIGPLPGAATAIYLAIGGGVLAALALACLADPRRDPVTTALWAQRLLLAFLLILSPNYPWYFLALVPLGCLAPWPPAQALTLLSLILYAAPPIDTNPRTAIVQSLVYASVIAALILDWYTSRCETANEPPDGKAVR